MSIVGVVSMIVAWFQISCFSYFAESIALKFKIDYFEKILTKDSNWFDQNNPGEMASKISKEVAAVQRGTGEKVGNLTMFVTSFIFGFAFAFFYGWLLTLILCGGIPFLLAVGALFANSLESGFTNQMKAYSQSAGYADQALNAIKVVHTYGQEALEETNY